MVLQKQQAWINRPVHDGWNVAVDEQWSDLCNKPIPVSATTTILAVAFNEGLARRRLPLALTLIGPAIHTGSLHIGNSLTQLAAEFLINTLAAGYVNDGFICGIGGVKTKKLWEATTTAWQQRTPPSSSTSGFGTRPGRARGAPTTSPCSRAISTLRKEADFEIRFILNLVRTKSPQVQPWLYIEWTEMGLASARPSSRDRAHHSNAEVWLALRGKSRMAAMVLYGAGSPARNSQTRITRANVL